MSLVALLCTVQPKVNVSCAAMHSTAESKCLLLCSYAQYSANALQPKVNVLYLSLYNQLTCSVVLLCLVQWVHFSTQRTLHKHTILLNEFNLTLIANIKANTCNKMVSFRYISKEQYMTHMHTWRTKWCNK